MLLFFSPYKVQIEDSMIWKVHCISTPWLHKGYFTTTWSVKSHKTCHLITVPQHTHLILVSKRMFHRKILSSYYIARIHKIPCCWYFCINGQMFVTTTTFSFISISFLWQFNATVGISMVHSRKHILCVSIPVVLASLALLYNYSACT